MKLSRDRFDVIRAERDGLESDKAKCMEDLEAQSEICEKLKIENERLSKELDDAHKSNKESTTIVQRLLIRFRVSFECH